MASSEISKVDSTTALHNAFQRLITFGDFPHAEPKSCWKQFKPFPFGLSLCGKPGELFTIALQGPFTDSLASTVTSLTD
jgi:hypothetical protein